MKPNNAPAVLTVALLLAACSSGDGNLSTATPGSTSSEVQNAGSMTSQTDDMPSHGAVDLIAIASREPESAALPIDASAFTAGPQSMLGDADSSVAVDLDEQDSAASAIQRLMMQ